jgi:hypothetical protein
VLLRGYGHGSPGATVRSGMIQRFQCGLKT